jgi:hypothetical protein
MQVTRFVKKASWLVSALPRESKQNSSDFRIINALTTL